MLDFLKRYSLHSSPECSPDYAKKNVKGTAINLFFCYASQTLRTTLQAVQLTNLGLEASNVVPASHARH